MRRGKGERWNGLQKFQFIYYLYIEDVHIVWNWYSDKFPSCWT
jgi:DMSO/TMAO reductase YedYZ heme-binding membrane subunit